MIPYQTKPPPPPPPPPKTFPTEPDSELLTWEKWITIRKEETTTLGKQTRRPPADLVMNLNEIVRPDKERKTVLEEAKINEKVGVRDSLWEQAQRLKQKCYCEPVYEVQRTAAELGRPRIIDHVDVPTEIKVNELGYTGVHQRINCTHLDREYQKYRQEREKELEEKILKIDPFRPEMGNLMIKGINPPPPPPKKPLLPDIKEILDNNTACDNLHDVYALRINNSIFLKDSPRQTLTDLQKMQKESWHENCTSWTYYFNTPVNRAGRGQLYLRNIGTVTIRYCWKKIRRPIPFILEDDGNMFFFNKNEDVLAPGQEKHIYFTFVYDKPGIYKEHWELSLCNVSFFICLTEKFVVNLLADSVEDYKAANKAVTLLKSDINLKSYQYEALKFIEQAVSNAVAIRPEIYPYKNYFLEAEMFVMKNPVCFYHQTEVAKMRDYYAEMSKGSDWDLSVSSWRGVMLTLEYDNRMKYYELLRKSYSDFLKPWYEGDDLLTSKYRVMKLLLGKLADRFDFEYDRITALYNPEEESVDDSFYASRPSRESLASVQPNIDIIRNLYYIQMYEHVSNTIETCAGLLSSLDLDRWIEFDFCRS